VENFGELAQVAPLDAGVWSVRVSPDGIDWNVSDPVHAQRLWRNALVLRLVARLVGCRVVRLLVRGEPYEIWTARPLPLPSSSKRRVRSQR
jgi:hypothetical protein